MHFVIIYLCREYSSEYPKSYLEIIVKDLEILPISRCSFILYITDLVLFALIKLYKNTAISENQSRMSQALILMTRNTWAVSVDSSLDKSKRFSFPAVLRYHVDE